MNDVKKFVLKQSGNCSVVLTAPHGGSPAFCPNLFIERPAHQNVVKKGDLKTCDLLHAIESKLASAGLKPYLVTLRVHRKFIDANRNILVDDQVAVHKDCELAKQVYKHYHESIEEMVGKAARNSSRVLLLDIHGMAPYADYIVCGTKNKTTCDADYIERDYTGFLFHLRKALGATVLPARDAATDVAKYSGGYTVQRHGGGRIDAIQLEFGAFLRKENQIDAAASAVASCIESTLDPMHGFLMDLGRWSSNVHAVDKVKAKLSRIHCFTPQDLRERLGSEKDSNINASLRFIGERPFRKDTLEAFTRRLEAGAPGAGAGAGADTREETEGGAVAGLKQGKSSVTLVRRIFVPEGDPDGPAAQWMRELLTRPTTTTEAMSAGSQGGGDLVVDAGVLRRLGPSGEVSAEKAKVQEGEAATAPSLAPDSVFACLERGGSEGRQGTSITFPSHEALKSALAQLQERLGGSSVVLESIDVEPSSTHCLAFVAIK